MRQREVDMVEPLSEVACLMAPATVWHEAERLVSNGEPQKLADLGIRQIGQHAPSGWLNIHTFYKCLAWDIPMRHYFALASQ